VMRICVWLQECRKDDSSLVGGKAANLGELLAAGIRVPSGFAVTAEAYRKVIESAGLTKKLNRLLSDLAPHDSPRLEEVSKIIRTLIERIELAKEIEHEIVEFYERLSEQYRLSEVPVAVRSSATAEDLPDASFAGQQETFLWVTGKQNVLTCVKRCWSSLFTPRAISYRIMKGFEHGSVYLSVCVQKMVKARVAGVMFTLNPANGDRSKIAISGSWGLGESVVSGEVTPDEWLIEKFTYEIVRERISHKHIERMPERGKVVVREVAPDRESIPCLSRDELRELARLGEAIEDHFGVPQDIEWAIDEDLPFPDNVFIVQSRPETVWTRRKKEAVVKSKLSATDFILDVLKTGRRL